jgi:alcohol dehydrogenase
VLEMAGSVRALESAVAMTRRGGTTVTAGLPPADAALAVDVVALVAEERTLKGSYIGTCVPARDIPRYVALYRAGRLPVDRLVSGYLTLDDINAGFDELHAGRAVRQIIRFDT